MGSVVIGGRPVGPQHPVFVIAEAGVNHNGDMAMAHRLIDVAADCGADAVKFQNFDAAKLVSRGVEKAKYQKETTGEGDQFEMLRKLQITSAQTRQLASHCRKRGVLFLSTPYDDTSADLLDRLNVAAIKIASTDTTNIRFLERIGAMGRPVILSTGMSEFAEVAEAVGALRRSGNDQIVLLHCTSSYPAPESEVNLRAILTMGSTFDVVPGYSDHTPGIGVGPYSVAFGAAVVEKHFTLNKRLPGPDHRASLNPTELRKYVREIRRIETLRGDGVKRVTAAERENRRVMQKSLAASRDLPSGHKIADADLVAMRPATGISAALIDQVVGRRLARSVKRLEQIQWDGLRP